jgi:hypothetical protein
MSLGWILDRPKKDGNEAEREKNFIKKRDIEKLN